MLALLLLIAAIFVGGQQPGAGSLFSAPWDKVAHFFTFGAIALLAGLTYPQKTLPLIMLLVISLGAADEAHQLFLLERQAGLDDLMADILGGLAAWPLIVVLRKLLQPTPA